MTVIPEEAVEAAAKAFWEDGTNHSWADEDSGVRGECLTSMRAALEAAAPHILASIMKDLGEYRSMLLEQSKESEVFGYHATGVGVALRIIKESSLRG